MQLVATNTKEQEQQNGVVGDSNCNCNNEPILLLNGFGVGSFHQHRLVHELMLARENDNGNDDSQQQQHRQQQTIYCMDYLGQGRS